MTEISRLKSVTARAGTNSALVKYWGKRDAALNLPAAGSLSLTLANLDGSMDAVGELYSVWNNSSGDVSITTQQLRKVRPAV